MPLTQALGDVMEGQLDISSQEQQFPRSYPAQFLELVRQLQLLSDLSSHFPHCWVFGLSVSIGTQ